MSGMVRIKSPQDLGAAAILLAIGIVGVWGANDLNFGTAARMGTGYFPVILSWCIIGFGLILAARSVTIQGPSLERLQIRPIGVLVVASLIFGYAIEQFGLAIASAAAIFVATYAKRGAKLKEAVILAIALTAFAIVVFVWALGQPLPVWQGR